MLHFHALSEHLFDSIYTGKTSHRDTLHRTRGLRLPDDHQYTKPVSRANQPCPQRFLYLYHIKQIRIVPKILFGVCQQYNILEAQHRHLIPHLLTPKHCPWIYPYSLLRICVGPLDQLLHFLMFKAGKYFFRIWMEESGIQVCI